jgi:hypothetical protein
MKKAGELVRIAMQRRTRTPSPRRGEGWGEGVPQPDIYAQFLAVSPVWDNSKNYMPAWEVKSSAMNAEDYT